MALEDIKSKIALMDDAKNKKREEMRNLYDRLIENEENLDLLIMQLGKEIGRLFPSLKFKLIARIKSEKSFEDKLENALNKCSDLKSVNDVQIYDIIGLNVVIEEVPNDVISEDFKKSSSYEDAFDLNITGLINERESKKLDMKVLKKIIKKEEKQIRKLKNFMKKKCEKLAKLKETILKNPDNEILKEIILDYENDINNCNMQIGELTQKINILREVLENTKKSVEDKNNECNHEFAKFIVRKLSDFEGIQILGLKGIKNRFKILDKDNGYKSIHNCFSFSVKQQDKKVKYICEIQGKSINAFNQANNGRAAKYHVSPQAKKGKRLKNKNLPDILSVNTPEEKEMFLKQLRKSLPKFRLYRNLNGNAEVYNLSLRECYMYYYYNQLFGNEILGIQKNNEHINAIVTSGILSDDSKIYTNEFEYEQIEDR